MRLKQFWPRLDLNISIFSASHIKWQKAVQPVNIRAGIKNVKFTPNGKGTALKKTVSPKGQLIQL